MTEGSVVKAIETRYKGYRFRSRLEARWAVFFETLRIEWQYEVQGFELPDGRKYLPDFYLPDMGYRNRPDKGLWVEIKGQYPSEEEIEKLQAFSRAVNQPLALLTNEIANVDGEERHYDLSGRWDHLMIFVRCYNCNAMKFEFSERNYMHCECCHARADEAHPTIKHAVEMARSARFEFGESGHE